ncbi:hypothetical protein SAMN05444162_1166 [Paenibacillaceae bacterium GAS479]|nr:hypothetical protein SAMN05444162_1166 [Paenibacillaceae bacterium GAS479]
MSESKPTLLIIFAALLMASIICLIPDSRSTNFFQFDTQLGSISPDKIVMVIIGFLTIIIVKKEKNKFNIGSNPFRIFYFIVMSTFITSLISLIFRVGFFGVNTFFYQMLMNYFSFFCVYSICTNFSNFKKYLINFIILFSSFSALVAVFQYIYKSPLFMSKYIYQMRGFYINGGEDYLYRVWGFQGEPQAIGTLCALGFLMSVCKIIENKRMSANYIPFILSSLVLVSGMVVSFSRGGIFSTILALFLIIKLYKIRISLKFIIGLIFSLFFISLILINTGILELLSTRIIRPPSGDNSYVMRWAIWTDPNKGVLKVFDLFGIQMLFGLSPGASLGIRTFTGVLDNNYLNIFYEHGIIGFILHTSLVIFALRSKAESPMLKIIIIAFVLNMFTYEITAYSSVGTFFWIALAILCADHFRKDVNFLKNKLVLPKQSTLSSKGLLMSEIDKSMMKVR